MELLDALRSDFVAHLPIFVRISSFFVAIPLFRQGVPALAKLAVAAIVTVLLRPAVAVPPLPEDFLGYSLIAISEAAVGLAIGLVVTTLLSALYLAGQFMDFPMGFGMVNVLDPQTGTQMPVLGEFLSTVAVLVLFLVDGHHVLLRTLAQSFAVLPIGAAGIDGAAVEAVTRLFSASFVLGLRIALPVMGALFLADVALGMVARAVPQINVFFVGFPLKIGLGFAVLALVLPAFVVLMAQVLSPSGAMTEHLLSVIGALRR